MYAWFGFFELNSSGIASDLSVCTFHTSEGPAFLVSHKSQGFTHLYDAQRERFTMHQAHNTSTKFRGITNVELVTVLWEGISLYKIYLST